MPYTGPGDPDLPDRIKKLSEEKRNHWVGAFNGRHAACVKEGESAADCEGSAFAVANAAIKSAEEGEGTGEKFESDEINGRPGYYDFIERQINQDAAAYNPVGGGDAKACANCQWFIAPMACAIIAGYPEPILPTGLSSLWREREKWEAKPLEVVIVGKDGDAEKAETKTEGGIEFKPSDYAVVPDAEKPSGWKLRLTEESSGNFTVAQVGRAITAMQPSGFRGQRVQLTAEQKSQAVSRIGTAIGKTGGSDEQKENLRERLGKVKEASVLERVVKVLKRALSADKPSEKPLPSGGFTVEKDSAGDLRWVAWVSNRWRDRDNPPEIIEEKAHEDYVAYLDGGGHYPEAWLWHTPGSKWGQADWADYSNGFLVMSGTVDKGMESVGQSLAKQDLGVSHGFWQRYSDDKRGIIGWYRTLELSPLPRSMAANPWTTVEMISEEAKTMDATKRAWLVGHLGEETVAKIEGSTEQLEKALKDAGIEWKEGETQAPVAGAPPTGATQPGAIELAEAAVKALTGSDAFKGLLATVESLGEKVKGIDALVARIAELEKTDDQKIADQLTGRVADRMQAFQATESKETVVEAGSPEAKAGPGGPNAWFDELARLPQSAPTNG